MADEWERAEVLRLTTELDVLARYADAQEQRARVRTAQARAEQPSRLRTLATELTQTRAATPDAITAARTT